MEQSTANKPARDEKYSYAALLLYFFVIFLKY